MCESVYSFGIHYDIKTRAHDTQEQQLLSLELDNFSNILFEHLQNYLDEFLWFIRREWEQIIKRRMKQKKKKKHKKTAFFLPSAIKHLPRGRITFQQNAVTVFSHQLAAALL